MIKVSCELEDYSTPLMPCIKIHNSWISKRLVELEIEGKRYTLEGRDLISAVENCMNTNTLHQ